MKKFLFFPLAVCLCCACGGNDAKDKNVAPVPASSPEPFAVDLVGRLHNEGLEYIFNELRALPATRATMTAAEKVAFAKSSIDRFLIDKGYEAFYANEMLTRAADIPDTPEGWNPDEVDLQLTQHQQAYLDRMNAALDVAETLEDATAAVEMLEAEAAADESMTEEQRTVVLVGLVTTRYSAEYWTENGEAWTQAQGGQPQPASTRGLVSWCRNWWANNQGWVVSDCIWAMEGCRTTWASGIPVVIVAGTVGAGAVASAISKWG